MRLDFTFPVREWHALSANSPHVDCGPTQLAVALLETEEEMLCLPQ